MGQDRLLRREEYMGPNEVVMPVLSLLVVEGFLTFVEILIKKIESAAEVNMYPLLFSWSYFNHAIVISVAED